jgi:hypothetical protein
MSNSLPTKALLIGIGRPLNYVPSKGDPDYIGEPLPNALEGYEDRGGFRFVFRPVLGPKNESDTKGVSLGLTTIREFNMLRFMNTVTDKQDWHIKVQPLIQAFHRYP